MTENRTETAIFDTPAEVHEWAEALTRDVGFYKITVSRRPGGQLIATIFLGEDEE